MLKHVVMIKLKENCTAAFCSQLLENLQQHVPAVRSVSWGSNVVKSPSSLDFCFVLEFEDLADLTAYDASDYHQKLRAEIRSIRTISHTVDYFETV